MRMACEADLPRIVEIYNAAIPGRLATADTEPVTVDARREWFRRHTSDRRPILVQEVDGRIVGWVSFESFYGRPAYGHTAELSLYIAPEWQRKGIGRQMLAQAIEMMPSLKIHTLVGYVFAHNTPSLQLLRSFGFEEWGRLPDIAVMDGKEYSLLIVGLRSAASKPSSLKEGAAVSDPRLDGYINTALRMGAAHARLLGTGDIVFDPRTILKCMYGCDDYGYGHTCPSRPGSPSVFEYERILRRYRCGILIHSHDKKLNHQISLEIERAAFLDGFYMAFSLSDCAICETCAGHDGKPCVAPKKARPAFHSVGIDVFKTVHQLGLPLRTLKDPAEEQNWYAFVFLV